MSSQPTQFVCKVVLIGDSGVGKTSIFNKRLYDKFNLNTQTTIQPGQGTLKIKVQNAEVILKLWDTAGQEKYRAMTVSFYKEAKGAFIVFDMNDKQTFENIRQWARQLKNHGGDDIVKVILANKCDLEQKVTEADIKELADSLNSQYFLVSAFTNQNILEAFDSISQEIYRRFYKDQVEQNQGVQLNQKSQKKSCC